MTASILNSYEYSVEFDLPIETKLGEPGVTRGVTLILENLRVGIPSIQGSHLRTIMLEAHNDSTKMLARPMVFLSGYSVSTFYFYGLPDAGHITTQEMCDKIQQTVRQVTVSIMAEGDNEYGLPMNVFRTEQSFDFAGAAGVMIEDQTWPKRSACDAQDKGLDIFVLVRTDVLIHGWDKVIARVKEFVRIEVDSVLIEALPDLEAMRRSTKEAEVPILANIIEGGKTENFSAKHLAEFGFCAVAYPVTLVVSNLANMRIKVENIKKSMKIGAPPEISSFEEVCLGVRFNKYWEIEERYKYNEDNLVQPVGRKVNGTFSYNYEIKQDFRNYNHMSTLPSAQSRDLCRFFFFFTWPKPTHPASSQLPLSPPIFPIALPMTESPIGFDPSE